MINKFKIYIACVPTPISGLALGIASLGFGLENALPLHTFGQSFGALAALILLFCLACKFFIHPSLLRQDLAHPIAGSILPTFSMTLMLISNSLAIISSRAAMVLWCTAVGMHIILLLLFCYSRIKNIALHHMTPSWFVPFVGINVAAVTVPCKEFIPFAYGLLIFGMISYAVLLPIMIYRLIFSTEMADASKPTIAILAAPASLSLVGYLNLEQSPSLLLCGLLLGIAILMTVIIYLAFLKLLRLPFSPAFAAYTFPMAISATALYKASGFIALYPESLKYARQLATMAVTEMIIASFIVGYVCIRYFFHYAQPHLLISKTTSFMHK